MNRYTFNIILMSVFGASKSVTIHSDGSLRDTGSLRCESNVTFICSIQTYKYKMEWLIDSDKVAECVTTNCVQYPPYKIDNIGFSPDTRNGEFNMTVFEVTLKADGRKIKCRYGSESVKLKLAVKVFPSQNKTKIVESRNHSQKLINITATTGCVFPRSAVSMQWYYYEEGHTPKLYNRSSPIEASNFSVCSSGTCGGNGVVKIASTLSIPDKQNGKEYFFQIAIRHDDTGDIILVNSTRSYKINEFPSEIVKEKDQLDLVLAICILTSSVVIVVGLVLTVAFKIQRNVSSSRGSGESRTCLRFSRNTCVLIERLTRIKRRNKKRYQRTKIKTIKASDAGSNAIGLLDKSKKEEGKMTTVVIMHRLHSTEQNTCNLAVP